MFIIICFYYILKAFYMISCYVSPEWRSHSWDYFLVQNSSKCKPTKSIESASNVKYWYVIKTTTFSCLIHLQRTHSLFLEGISYSSVGLVRYPYTRTTHVFSTYRLNTHMFLSYIPPFLWLVAKHTSMIWTPSS